MDIYQFPGLVIVDDDEMPIGILTEGDIVRAVHARGNVTSLAEEPAEVYATKEPIVLPADAEIGEAFHRMVMSGLTILPVVEENRLIGMLLRVDLMHAMFLDAAAHSKKGERS
jgi:CBS domain-containing protein